MAGATQVRRTYSGSLSGPAAGGPRDFLASPKVRDTGIPQGRAISAGRAGADHPDPTPRSCLIRVVGRQGAVYTGNKSLRTGNGWR